MEYCIDMRLQTPGIDEINIASIGGFPQHGSCYAASVLLNSLCEIFNRTENLLVPQAVFCVSLLLAS